MTQPTNLNITVRLKGWRNRRGQLQRATEAMVGRQRIATRSYLRLAKELAEKESPVGVRVKGRRYPAKRFREQWATDYQEKGDGAVGTLENTSPLAGVVIFPTRPHEIKPRRARFLAFERSGPGTGTWVRAKRVSHPGTKGNNVPARVLRAMESWAGEELRRVARQAEADIVEVFND